MKAKLVLGTFLIVVGFILAVVAAAGLREPGNVRTAPGVIVGDQNQRGRDEAASIMLPVLAGCRSLQEPHWLESAWAASGVPWLFPRTHPKRMKP